MGLPIFRRNTKKTLDLYAAYTLILSSQGGVSDVIEYESPSTVGIMCRTASRKVEGLEGFHFHQLRHTFTSNLLSNGAAPKDVQELLGHADVSTTMNIYAHATREAKRTSARLLDKVVGGE